MEHQGDEFFDGACKVLLSGAWLIENGHGRLALLPYVYAAGHWRCEFHLVGRPQKTLFKYSAANGSAYLASHSGGSVRKDISPEELAHAILVSVPDALKEQCSGHPSPATIEWVAALRNQLASRRVPVAFGEFFGERGVWHLQSPLGKPLGLTMPAMPAMPGYVKPGEEPSVLDDVFWSQAERRAKCLAKRPEFSLSSNVLGDGDRVFEIANRLRCDLAEVNHLEAPRLLRAAIAALQAASSNTSFEQSANEVSTYASEDPTSKRATRLLSMVHELHKAGYQRLRVACGWDAQGKIWRARLIPSSRVSDDGWTPISEEIRADYSTTDGKAYFGWTDTAGDDARTLANKFIDRFPRFALEASGHDWAYVGWFSTVLCKAEHGDLPAFFGFDVDGPSILPPMPLDNTSRQDKYSSCPPSILFIANDDLVLADLPMSGASYDEVTPFCLSFDGYKGGLLQPSDCWEIAEKAKIVGLANCGINTVRTIAFIHQRKLKNESEFMDISSIHPSMQAIHQAVEEIRRRLAE